VTRYLPTRPRPDGKLTGGAWKEQAGASPYVVAVASALDGGRSHLLRLCVQDPNRGEPGTGVYLSPPDGIVPDMERFMRQAPTDQ
jgi:hypothetical protein